MSPAASDSKPDKNLEERLRVEIRYLTSALSGRSLSVAPKTHVPSNVKAKVVAFSHLSNLFCLGGVKSCPAIAVTGTLEKEQVSLVVSTNNRTDDNNFIPTVLQIVPEPESSNPSIFTEDASAPPATLLKHIQLCQLGLRLLRQHQITGGQLHRWFLAHGSEKICKHLRSITSRWEGDVLEVLTQFDPKDVADTLHGNVSCLIESDMGEKIMAVAPQLIKGTEQELETVVDRSTAAAWTGLLAECVRGIGRAMGVPPFGVSHDISESDIADAHRWIHVLFSVTNSPAIIALFSLYSLSKLLIPKASGGLRPEFLGTDDASDEDEVGLLEEGIPDGAKFLRHLGTLASWYSGIFYFVRPRNLADTVRIQIVRVAEPPREDDNFRSIDESILTRAADSIRAHASDDMLAAIPPGDTLQDLSAQLRRPSDTSRVHCEASIMALVVEPDVELITPQTTSGWPIGASKKCCWTCWKLGELLGQDGTYFAVSGTHKIIFGWVPPTGLPINVLARVRDALLEEYAKVCEAELKISRRSGQTSPVSDVEDNAKMLS